MAMTDDLSGFDVLVIGGGNAALAAALSARETGASVLVLEGAPKEFRGGNSRHTRNLRCMHDAPTKVMTDAYSEDEFYNDISARDRRPDQRAISAHDDPRFGLLH
jgi:tricarballylate dehydrogenase